MTALKQAELWQLAKDGGYDSIEDYLRYNPEYWENSFTKYVKKNWVSVSKDNKGWYTTCDHVNWFIGEMRKDGWNILGHVPAKMKK